MPYLPISREECPGRPDFIVVSGDAYVDHPSFGAAVIARVVEAEGFTVAMLPQPDFRAGPGCMTRYGPPRYAFLVAGGNLDSMVAHYTAAKKRRSNDYYTPGGKAGRRPDRAVTVYCRLIRQAYPDAYIVAGGLEASLRRFAHYDYWSDSVLPGILADCGADALVFGCGERPMREIAAALRDGEPDKIRDIRGVCWQADSLLGLAGQVTCPSFDKVKADKQAYARATAMQYREQDPIRGRRLVQAHGGRWIVQNPPAMPLTRAELDAVYDLPFMRYYHPAYEAEGGVPAIDEVEFSIAHVRGCFGACAFCSIAMHQGRHIVSRSHESALREAALIMKSPRFKGYIHDVGGPTANFREPSCDKAFSRGMCADRRCLTPSPCPNLKVDHGDYLALLRKLRALPGVKKVFVRSGLRHDYICADPDGTFLRELARHHVSGQLKVAPEHSEERVLRLMGKPAWAVFLRFRKLFAQESARAGLKQYLVPYLMSSHPGAGRREAEALSERIRELKVTPEQVQDFYPTPGTLSTCMFHTGLDPLTGARVHVAGDMRGKALQRAMLQPGKYRR